jgi:hypothetical protein
MRPGAGMKNFMGNAQWKDTGHSGGTVTYTYQTINEGTIYYGRAQQTGATRHHRVRNNIILMEIGA